jgi:hypothetical protein
LCALVLYRRTVETTVDFVAFDADKDAWLLVLVEQGPWRGDVEERLRRLQDRLYGCLEAALDGQVAERFPETANKKPIIRVDCYNVPRDDVDDFMRRFLEGIREVSDYSPNSSPWVRSFEFEVNYDQIH